MDVPTCPWHGENTSLGAGLSHICRAVGQHRDKGEKPTRNLLIPSLEHLEHPVEDKEPHTAGRTEAFRGFEATKTAPSSSASCSSWQGWLCPIPVGQGTEPTAAPHGERAQRPPGYFLIAPFWHFFTAEPWLCKLWGSQ